MTVRDAKRVLVLDGGCIRGLGCLQLLATLFKRIQGNPSENFDMICGSGCGGLLAILLGRLRMDCDTAISSYRELIFSLCGYDAAHFHRRILEEDGMLDTTKFDMVLENIIQENLGESPSMISIEDDADKVKTLVTTVHNNSNHVYQIRSYPAPTTTPFECPPTSHAWSVFEAAKATFACPFFMRPIIVEGRFRYSDAGFAGFNNPINQVFVECQKLWDDKAHITFVCLGTSLDSIATGSDCLGALKRNHPTDWDLDSSVYLEKEKAFFMIAERFSALAKVAQNATLKFSQGRSNRRQVNLSTPELLRLDPPLHIPEVSLCDVYYEADIRHSVDEWLEAAGVSVISKFWALSGLEMLAIDITRAEMEEKIREAQFLDVPKPEPATVNTNYNPELDKRRPTYIDDFLSRYHVLFIIDDSQSMKGKLWKEAQEALKKISDYAVVNKTAKIEVMFLNDPLRISAIQGGSGILSIFNYVSPKRGTPTGERLRQVLDNHMNRLDAAVGDAAAYSSIHPLSIIVITDGRPTDDPAAVMQEAATRMRRSKHHPNCITVQFVQIGNDKKAKRSLEMLVYGENGCMVDTVPYDGVLTPRRLERILLGGLHPNVRALIL